MNAQGKKDLYIIQSNYKGKLVLLNTYKHLCSSGIEDSYCRVTNRTTRKSLKKLDNPPHGRIDEKLLH